MKLKILSFCLLTSGLVAITSGCATSKENLKAKAQITEAQAREIALSKAPGGTIKTAELENEKGNLIWSFDIATPGSRDITEVNVDAKSGKVIAVDKESPAKEEKEAKAEKEEKEGKEISEAKAREIALSKVPGGTITKADHDNEDGKWMWSFDISTPGNTENIAIDVDAKTGEIISIEHEKGSAKPATPASAKKPAKPAWKENVAADEKNFSSTGRNKYFILEPGYELVLAGEEDGKPVELKITVLDETKMIDGVETRVVVEDEHSGDKPIEIARNYFAYGKDTHHIFYFGEDVDEYGEGGKISHPGSWLAGVNGAKAGVMVPGNAKAGQKYYQERAPKVALDRAENLSVSETLETKAGAFKNCLKTKETTPLEPKTVEYKIYAPEIGIAQDGTLKLVKYGFVKK